MSEPSNQARPRRNDELKFAYAGPFVRLLNPIRPVKPERDATGNVLAKQPRYIPTAAESWTIQSRLPGVAGALERLFGREYNSVLDAPEKSDPLSDPMSRLGANAEPGLSRPKRRRGRRGGRKHDA